MPEQQRKILSRILNGRERVLVCLPEDGEQAQLWKTAIVSLGCVPDFWEEGFRWDILLRRAFDGRYRVIVGSPRVLLGLGKLSRYTRIPLCIRSAVLTESCPDWLSDAIGQSLDCRVWMLPEKLVEHRQELAVQEEHMLRWSSVLDVRLVRGPYGLELEAVVFPGKRLPAFPGCAKQRVDIWRPEQDIPFFIRYDAKKWKNH